MNTWVFSEARGIAPAGTTSVQLLALNVDFGNGANHPMWFDNITGTLIPEPTAALLAGLGIFGLVARRR